MKKTYQMASVEENKELTYFATLCLGWAIRHTFLKYNQGWEKRFFSASSSMLLDLRDLVTKEPNNHDNIDRHAEQWWYFHRDRSRAFGIRQKITSSSRLGLGLPTREELLMISGQALFLDRYLYCRWQIHRRRRFFAKETNKKNNKVLCCSRTSGSGFWIIRRFECTMYVVTATAHLATLSLRPSLRFLPYCVSGPWWVTPFLWLFAAAAMVVRNLRKIRAKSSHAKQMATHCKSGKLPATSPFTWRRWRRYMQQVMRSHEQVGQATKVPLFGSFLLLRLLTFSNWTVKLPTSSSSDLGFDIDPNHDTIGVSRKKNNPAWLTIITEYIIAEVLLNSSLQPFRSSSFELTRKDEEKKK